MNSTFIAHMLMALHKKYVKIWASADISNADTLVLIWQMERIVHAYRLATQVADCESIQHRDAELLKLHIRNIVEDKTMSKRDAAQFRAILKKMQG